MSNSNISKRESDTLHHIRNSIAHEGKAPSVRSIMALLGYKSPNSAMVLINELIANKYLKRKPNGELQLLKDVVGTPANAQTVDVPLVGNVACGLPLLAEENLEMMVSVSVKLAKPPHTYFLLRAKGDSMDKKGIKDGNLVLVRQQPNADNGQAVVALINDNATVKELHKSDNVVILKPQSSNPENKPIILSDDFQIQGVVVASLPSI